jgi:UDP-galactopyranose mutase
MKKYDYIIVGSGLFGSIFARELTDNGFKCLVIDKRSHIGGNCYTEEIEGINVHKYGAHIFHTSDDGVWEYMNRFCKFNHYVNRPKVNYKGKIYSFPINLMTLYQLYGVTTPEQAKIMLNYVKHDIENPKNLEEWILSQVGTEIYEIFIKGYTTKQWGREPKLLPSSIIRRLPIRLTFDENYFFDKYQGIPIGGYTKIFEKLLDGIAVKLDVDYFEDKQYWDNQCDKVVYTGPIDRYYDYKFGKLEYRSLDFKTEIKDIEDFQGNAVINYTDVNPEYTRIIEHKHFEFGKQKKTVITTEYPNSIGDPYYPVNDTINNSRYNQYKELMNLEDGVIFGGRLADYKYYDMHQVVASALKRVKDEIFIKTGYTP